MEEVLKLTKTDLTDYTHCPSCGKSTPKYSNSCHRCGASFLNRFSLKRVHLAMLLIGVIGFGFLGYAYYEATHIVSIEKIDAKYEDKTVIISGIITDLRFDSRYEKTEFTITDATDSIQVYGWSEFSSDLLKSDKFPELGDNLIIEGLVNSYETDWSTVFSIEIDNTDAFEVEYINPLNITLSEIEQSYEEYLGVKVRLSGNITDSYIGYSGSSISYISLTMTYEDNDIIVFIDDDLLQFAHDNFVLPEIYDFVQITGIIDIFQDELEIIPSRLTNSTVQIMEAVNNE